MARARSGPPNEPGFTPTIIGDSDRGRMQAFPATNGRSSPAAWRRGQDNRARRPCGNRRSQYLTINPDKIKEELARRDASRRLTACLRWKPPSWSTRSHLTSRSNSRCEPAAEGKNLIWDITMSSRESDEKRISDLRTDGYTSVSGIFVDIPIDVSLARADARHREGEDRLPGWARARRPVRTARTSSPARPMQTGAARTGEPSRSSSPDFDQWTLFDNGVDGREPVRIAESRHHDSPRRQRHDQRGHRTDRALRDGTMSLDEVAQRFRARAWPRRPGPGPPPTLNWRPRRRKTPGPTSQVPLTR